MKKLIPAFFPWLFVAFGYKAEAQDGIKQKDKKNKETEEIVIRKKGSKDANINIQINGDKITINGKPLSEYKDDEISINKRKMSVNNGNVFAFGGGGDNDFSVGPIIWDDNDENSGAFLGVSTEKADGGARITDEVSKESGAGKAGLKKDDIITKFGDKAVDGPQSLFEAVNEKKPKDEVKVTYLRDGKEKTVTATLGKRKGSYSKSYSYTAPDGSYKSFTLPYDLNGEKLQDLQYNMEELKGLNQLNSYNDRYFPRSQKLGLKIQDTEDGNGVKVLEVQDSSSAAIAGIKKDDIIIEVGTEKVSNTDEAREQFLEYREKGSYPVKVRRNGSEMTFTVKIPKKLKTANL